MQEDNLKIQGLKKPIGEGPKIPLYQQRSTPYSRILFGLISVIIFSLEKLLNGLELEFIRTKGKVRL